MTVHGYNIHLLTIYLGHMDLLLFPCFFTCFLLVTFLQTAKEPENTDAVPAIWFIICSQDFKGVYYELFLTQGFFLQGLRRQLMSEMQINVCFFLKYQLSFYIAFFFKYSFNYLWHLLKNRCSDLMHLFYHRKGENNSLKVL